MRCMARMNSLQNNFRDLGLILRLLLKMFYADTSRVSEPHIMLSLRASLRFVLFVWFGKRERKFLHHLPSCLRPLKYGPKGPVFILFCCALSSLWHFKYPQDHSIQKGLQFGVEAPASHGLLRPSPHLLLCETDPNVHKGTGACVCLVHLNFWMMIKTHTHPLFLDKDKDDRVEDLCSVLVKNDLLVR